MTRHARWVRLSHWVATLGFIGLAFSGYVILMAHPRLYWGNTGNDLTPAILELPISRNYRHGGFERAEPIFQNAQSPISAVRTFRMFNQNGWGRSLHFLSAWVLVAAGGIYLLIGAIGRHFGRHLLPHRAELTTNAFRQEIRDHARLKIRPATGGPSYGLLQKCAYSLVVFVVLPFTAITGLAMSPAVAAAVPLPGIFGGVQSARTLHFVSFVILVVFFIVHVAMIVKSGFARQMRAMTFGA
jgi:thiosulfate reductase cytochrome b subunit